MSHLPTDIFQLVFGHLDAHDVRNLRQVSREFYELSNLRSIWEALLRRHVILQNIPIPRLNGKSVESLTARELEEALHRALKLRRNWTKESPRVERRVNLDAIIPHHRNVSLHFLPDGKLVSLSMSRNRVFILQCWDLCPSEPICLATRQFDRCGGLAINKSSGTLSDGIVAILNPHLEILCLDLHATDPTNGFRNLATIQDVTSGIHFFSGSSILTKDTHGRLYFWGINNSQNRVQLQNPDLNQLTALLDVIVTQEFVLALRATTLELYALPSSLQSNAILHPAFIHSWPWRVDNATMTMRQRPPRRSSERTTKDVYIVMRFGSYFPWAINLLHHYEIHANPLFLKDSPISALNLPYEFPPFLRETIGSPVRLHATSDLAIGPYGSAIWTDSHTEDYFDHADHGQRLAGRFSPYVVANGEDNEEIELSDSVATASATSVYAYQEEDSWVRIAFDETEGRIVLGRGDGVITILEYI
ncbi:hypothetical protein CPB84DRAFT_1678892 [Gymnopilus junonius]|uniref:F-box domain-containing protein n=1 Tax=Gymnopilus junonius TaxID=109634 RepID=A0A9P5NMJ8_GYMJU|nr:hypothetical protein CPB84DRAFT_1678892 [Gymnopilus junonius]